MILFKKYYIILILKGNVSYAASSKAEETQKNKEIEYSEVEKVDIDKVINQNSKQSTSEELRQEDVALEYLTEYIQSDEDERKGSLYAGR